MTAATLQLERVQVVLEQTLRRCDQLEKEKVCRSRLIGVIYIHFYLANLFFYDSTSSATQEIGIVCCYCCFSSPEIVDSSISLTHTHTLFVHFCHWLDHLYRILLDLLPTSTSECSPSLITGSLLLNKNKHTPPLFLSSLIFVSPAWCTVAHTIDSILGDFDPMMKEMKKGRSIFIASDQNSLTDIDVALSLLFPPIHSVLCLRTSPHHLH